MAIVLAISPPLRKSREDTTPIISRQNQPSSAGIAIGRCDDPQGPQFGLSAAGRGVGSWWEDRIFMSTAIEEPKQKAGTQLNQLEQLKKFTKIVADTADFESMKAFKPEDATTNPSLVLAAIQKQNYAHLLEEVLRDRKNSGPTGAKQIDGVCDHLLVQFGTDILEIVPGRVS